MTKQDIRDYVVSEMLAGVTAMRLQARLAITQGGGEQAPGMIKVMAGFSGFTSQTIPPISRKEFEVWDGEVIILPRRIYRGGPYGGWSIEDILMDNFGGDMERRFRFCEKIKS